MAGKGKTIGAKGGDLLHVADLIVLDRLQNAGPQQITQNKTKVYELGRRPSIGVQYDTPSLSWSLESLDVSGQFESRVIGGKYAGRSVTDAAITAEDSTLTSDTAAFTQDDVRRIVTVEGAGVSGADLVALITSVSDANTVELNVPAATTVSDASVSVSHGAYDVSQAVAFDVLAQFMDESRDVVAGVVVPYLTLDSYDLNVGVKANSTLKASLTSNGMFWDDNAAYSEKFSGTGATNQAVALSHPAVPYSGDVNDGTKYALVVTVAGQRLFVGADYTETHTGSDSSAVVTLHLKKPVATTDEITVTYFTTVAQTYPDAANAAVSAVRPAAVRGENVRVLLGGVDLSAQWSMVQSAQVSYKANLTEINELGNANAIGQDAETPDVTGNVVMLPRNPQELIDQLRKTAGIASGEVIGPNTHISLALYVVIYSPIDGTPLKTYEVPDAQFTLPGYQGQVNTSMQMTFNFDSASGQLFIYEGLRPGLNV